MWPPARWTKKRPWRTTRKDGRSPTARGGATGKTQQANKQHNILYRYRRWRSRANFDGNAPPSVGDVLAGGQNTRQNSPLYCTYAARRDASDVTRRGSRCCNCTVRTGGVDIELISSLPLTPHALAWSSSLSLVEPLSSQPLFCFYLSQRPATWLLHGRRWPAKSLARSQKRRAKRAKIKCRGQAPCHWANGTMNLARDSNPESPDNHTDTPDGTRTHNLLFRRQMLCH